MLNLNLERYGRFLLNGVELDRLQLGTGEAVKAVPTATEKASAVQLKPTRVVKNLFDKNNRTRILGYFASSGTTWSYNASAYSNKIPCKSNTTYTARYNGNSTQAVLGFGSCSTDEEPSASTGNVTVTQGVRQNNPTRNTPITITTGHNDKWLIVAYNVAEPQNTDMADNLQIEEAATATPLYPYFAPETILPSLKAYGATPVKHKAPKLWGQYVPCEYIGFDGSSYIDLAPLTTESDIEITFRRQDGYTQTNFLFGTNPDSSSSQMVGAWYGSSGFTMQNGAARKSVTLDTNWHTLKFTSTKTYLDGVEQADAGVRTYFQNLVIGSARQPNSSGAVDDRRFRGDISRVKVGNKIFTACKDVTANTFGLLDPAENKFYGNAGTGAFTGGELIQPVKGVTNGASSNFDSEVKAADNLEMFIRFKAITGSFYIFQSRQSTSATIYGISGGQSGNTINAYGITSGISRTAGHIYTVKMTMVNRAVTLYVKDETEGTEDTKTGTAASGDYPFPSPTTIKLYGDASKVDSGVTVYDAYIKTNGEYVWKPAFVRVGTTVEMLDLVSWSFAPRTGTFTAGADIPYAQMCPDVIKVNTGDLAYGLYSANMFDKTAVKAGYYLNDSGAEVSNGIWNISDYMPVVGGETYYQRLRTPGQSPRTCWYDANKVFISAVAQVAGGTQTAPANAKYCRMCVIEQATGTADLGYAMFTHGADAPTEYEPYKFGLFTDGSHKLFIGSQGVVDLGTLTWSYVSPTTSYPYGYFRTTIADKNTAGNAGMYLDGYTAGAASSADKHIWGSNGYSVVAVSDSRYSDAASFKAAMSGKYLFYQRTDDTAFIPPISRDIPMLLSADSFVDTQVDSNNKSEAWAAIWYDGTQDVPSGYISQTGDLTPDQIVLYPLATPALSTHAIAPVELTEKATYTAAGTAELPVTEQATYLGIGDGTPAYVNEQTGDTLSLEGAYSAVKTGDTLEVE